MYRNPPSQKGEQADIMTINKNKIITPEQLSGHDLVNYLIENPKASGNFKWNTLRSCMWKNLLIPCPQFADFADYQKITHYDARDIVKANLYLAPKFPRDKFNDSDWVEFLSKAPELAEYCDLNSFSTSHWQLLVSKQKAFADRCPWEKFNGSIWRHLLLKNSNYADRCNWSLLSFWDWEALLKKKRTMLPYLKLEYVKNSSDFLSFMHCCYLGEKHPPKGLFVNPPQDVETYLVYKSMDRENAKYFLKKKYFDRDWKFIKKLCKISPEEATAVPGAKYIPFYIALAAPSDVFKLFFQTVDTSLRDSGGNSLLLPALLCDLSYGRFYRSRFMQSHGLDPDAVNLAGFSCNDYIEHIKKYRKSAKEIYVY